MYYLIDTHVLIWYLDGNKKLPEKIREIVTYEDNEIAVSVASLWELAIKISNGKFDSKLSLKEIQSHILERQFTLLSISYEHLNTLTLLPYHHGDPFDRLLIAQAITENVAIISIDKHFKSYPANVIL
jgi:PIN domain nuclease of toxin-antitoxin system